MTRLTKGFFLPGVFAVSVVLTAFLLVWNTSAQTAPPPTTLTAVIDALSPASQINLSWQDVANETGYLLYRSKNSSFANAIIISLSQDIVSYKNAGLETDTTYYYQVWACNAADCSQSNIANAQTTGTPEPTITNVNPISACGFDVLFTSGADSTKYDAMVSTSPTVQPWSAYTIAAREEGGTLVTGSGPLSFFSTSENFAKEPRAVPGYYKPNTTYYFKVKNAEPSGGEPESDWSSIKDGSTPPLPTKPGAPGSLSAKWSNGRINLEWQKGSPLSNKFSQYGGYEVYKAKSNNSGESFLNFELLERTAASISEKFNDSSALMNPDEAYKYAVLAYESDKGCLIGNANSTGDETQYVRSELSQAVTVPMRPREFKVEPKDGKLVLSWVNSMKGDKMFFEIWRKFEGNETTLTAYETSYEDSVQKDKVYEYKVRTCFEGGACSAFTDTKQGSVGIASEGDFFRSRIVHVSESSNTAIVDLQWTASGNTEYSIKRNGADVPQGVFITDSGFQDLSAPINTTHKYELFIDGAPIASAFVNVDLNINMIIKGVAWSGYKEGGSLAGAGWISLNSDTEFEEGGVHSNVNKYSVQVHKDGTISGIAWGYIKSADDKFGGVGWISFNKKDLRGCPDGNCVAKVNSSSGKVTGWARALFDEYEETRELSWDGFIKLRLGDDSNGLCFGTSKTETNSIPDGKACDKNGGVENPYLSGVAWGGSPVGWIAFLGGKKTSSDALSISPPLKRLVIFEKGTFVANKDVNTWWVDGVHGGNQVVGTVVKKNNTKANEGVVYTAPATGGTHTLVAKKGSEGADADIIVRDLPYYLSCFSPSKSDIVVRWNPYFSDRGYGTSYAKHTITLMTGESSPPNEVLPDAVNASEQRYIHEGLGEGTTHYYKLKITYTGEASMSVETPIIKCTTNVPPVPLVDMPTSVGVFPNSSGKIYVNWKDNTTTTSKYFFEIQRIKVTPATSTELRAKNVKSDYVELEWKTNTTSTPYEFEIQRSSNPLGSKRFSKDDSMSTMLEGISGYGNFSLPPGAGVKTYTYRDENLEEATTYYYRVRTCSLITLDENQYPKAIAGTVGAPTKVCGWFSPFDKNIAPGGGTPDGAPDGTPPLAVATTTPPQAPSEASAFALSYNKINLEWMDNSSRETGYEIKRNGVVVTEVSGDHPMGTIGTVSYIDYNDLDVKLIPGTLYTYTIRAYYDIPGGGRVYSDAISTSEYTHFEVSTGFSGDGSGQISLSDGSVVCPGSCKRYFQWGSSVSLFASPNAGSVFNNWSGDVCSESLSETCSFIMGTVGNVQLSANFSSASFLLKASVIGAGSDTITGSGLKCTKTGGPICSVFVDKSANVTLSAAPAPASSFDAWHGVVCQEGQNSLSCSFVMNSAKTVSARFNLVTPSNAPSLILVGAFRDFRDIIKNSSRGALYLFKGLLTDISPKTSPVGTANALSKFETAWASAKAAVESVRGYITGLFSEYAKKSSEVARGQSEQNLDAYFNLFKDKDGKPVKVKNPVYIDENVEPDSVYVYRVRVVYEDDFSRTSEWSIIGAGKSLREEGTHNAGEKRPICTRNSYCDYSVTMWQTPSNTNFDPPIESSLQQCQTNAWCRDVGRQDQRYEER